MTSYRITCVVKPDRFSRHEHITSVGGPAEGGWRATTPQVIQWIESNTYSFYTFEGGVRAEVGVRETGHGTKYIQTYADGVWGDNLLSLTECSVGV
ncbi:MAG: DUF3892 domain-containing protein [Acidobacteriota bacterium]|nr:DUF3892 domain-containing protein [Acidobacteriota bacterium]